MNTVQIHPSNLKGSITIAPSKSVMQRVCAAALLHKGKTIIHHPGKSNDDMAALSIIQQLGARVNITENTIEVFSNGIQPKSTTIDCGESGLSARMFASIIALHDKEIELTGDGSLQKRPLDWFHEVFTKLNVEIQSQQGFLPLKIKGPMQPKNIVVDGSSSSQYLTGLLMAYSLAITNNSLKDETIIIEVLNLNSKPYIDITIQVMKDFGMLVPENLNYEKFIFHTPNNPINELTNNPINQLINKPLNYTIEGDWSGAAFFLVAAAIHGNITVKGLQPNSYQADKKIIEVLETAGANFIIENSNYIFAEATPLNSFEFDATDCPDLFPPLVALASFCNGISTIKGVHRLKHKESNRAISLQTEFKKFGVDIIIENDTMKIHPTQQPQSAIIDSHNDHRIAMAAAIVATKANAPVTILHSNAIKKSYPSFYNDLQKLNAEIIFSL
jgi:3-phosphoshikimate 1-carboxyvinyltransferase